ncbi:MAG TPA: hypothetical protein VFP98_10370 [Candidatus Polarisedimenticolia bacterium]|nr:hypothetical protein [Candidatus Polarisedimenticolia bacterium]
MDIRSLRGMWVHAPEEDTAAEMVFRPESDLPERPKHRATIELKPDGSYVFSQSDPEGFRQEGHGRWRLRTDGRLTLEPAGRAGRGYDLQVVRADRNHLVIAK